MRWRPRQAQVNIASEPITEECEQQRAANANDTCRYEHRERTQNANGVEVYTFDNKFDNKELIQTTIARYRRVKKKKKK